MGNVKEELIAELGQLYDKNTEIILRLVQELKEDKHFSANDVLEVAEMLSHFKNLNEVYNNTLNKLK